MDPTNRPIAAPGLISYRLKTRYGYVTIGATDTLDALKQALRSTLDARVEHLEIWDGEKYVAI
jgi:AAA+ superfamily predicted ATPase